jgi:uroporphyrinogen decarboxylase
MNPRKLRVIKAISHEEPDKVPAHMNATKWVVAKLKKALAIETDKELLETLNIDIYDMRGIDIHSGTVPEYIGPPNEFFTSNWKGGIGSFWRIREIENKTSSGWTLDMGAAPLSGDINLDIIEKYPWPENDWFGYSNIRNELEQWSEFAVMATGASVFQHVTFIRGMDNLMMDMMVAPELANYMMDRVFAFYHEYYRRMFEAAGDMIDIFAMADDLGMQNSLLISPEMIEEFVVPRFKKMIDLAHNYGIKFLLHTDGNVESIIPLLIDIGVDILDPIQPECMDPVAIKRKFGRDICLRGGISVQDVFSRGSIDDVVKETRRIVEALKPGGGYILAPGHPVLQDDIPVENILALYETSHKYGFY